MRKNLRSTLAFALSRFCANSVLVEACALSHNQSRVPGYF